MKGRVFLDTNILVYADDAAAGARHERARGILEEIMLAGTGVLSTQVLQEYFVIATRKLDVDAALARRKVELFATMDVVQVRVDLILAAADLHRLHQISFWDALVLKCASAAGCVRLLTEDLTHGQVLAGVRIEDPFRRGAE